MVSVFFVIVTKKLPGYETPAVETCGTATKALRFISTIGAEGSDDPRRVERVFEIDHMGHVKHYRIVFNGRLELEEVPEHAAAESTPNGWIPGQRT